MPARDSESRYVSTSSRRQPALPGTMRALIGPASLQPKKQTHYGEVWPEDV